MTGRSGNGRWLTALATASVVAAAACSSPAPADKVAGCAKAADEGCLARLLESGNSGERARALEALVAMKSKAAVPALLSTLLITLQTGGDGAEVAAKITGIDAGAVRRAYEEQVAKEVGRERPARRSRRGSTSRMPGRSPSSPAARRSRSRPGSSTS